VLKEQKTIGFRHSVLDMESTDDKRDMDPGSIPRMTEMGSRIQRPYSRGVSRLAGRGRVGSRARVDAEYRGRRVWQSQGELSVCQGFLCQTRSRQCRYLWPFQANGRGDEERV